MFFENSTGIYQWGLEIIYAIQSCANPFLTACMKILSYLGDPTAYVLFLGFMYWCINEKKGHMLISLLLLSSGCNSVIKNTLQVARPFVLDPSVKMIPETGFSTPSAHSQVSATFWASFLFTLKNPPSHKRLVFFGKIAISILIPFFIGVSRVYLGVHFPTDVFLGWGIGVGFLFIALFIWKPCASLIAKLPHSAKLFIAVLPSFVLLTINKHSVSAPGVFFGFSAGFIFLQEQGSFSAAKGLLWQKILRFLLGSAVAALLMITVYPLLPPKNMQYYNLTSFAFYALIGFWLSYGAPKIFIACKLAEKEHQ